MENNRIHILVVDDDNRIRDLLKEYLNDNNHIVSTSENAENAKAKLKQFKFDLIVLDVMMPGQNGFDLAKEIKKNLKTPIIFLTAKGEVEDRIKGLELGVDDYIGKPFEPKELLLRINNIISKTNTIDLNIKYSVGVALIDLNKMNIKLKTKNTKINISEKKVLVEMLSNPGKTFTRDEIGKISESKIFGPENEAERTSIVSFEIKNHDPEKIVSVLAQKGIIIAKREIYEKPILRISPHVYNTKDEILELVEELKKLWFFLLFNYQHCQGRLNIFNFSNIVCYNWS